MREIFCSSLPSWLLSFAAATTGAGNKMERLMVQKITRLLQLCDTLSLIYLNSAQVNGDLNGIGFEGEKKQ